MGNFTTFSNSIHSLEKCCVSQKFRRTETHINRANILSKIMITFCSICHLIKKIKSWRIIIDFGNFPTYGNFAKNSLPVTLF